MDVIRWCAFLTRNRWWLTKNKLRQLEKNWTQRKTPKNNNKQTIINSTAWREYWLIKEKHTLDSLEITWTTFIFSFEPTNSVPWRHAPRGGLYRRRADWRREPEKMCLTCRDTVSHDNENRIQQKVSVSRKEMIQTDSVNRRKRELSDNQVPYVTL